MRLPRLSLPFLLFALFHTLSTPQAEASADLSVTWEAAQPTADSGDRVQYLARIHNLGPDTAIGANLTISIPLGFAPVPAVGWNCSPMFCAINIGDLLPTRAPVRLSFAMDVAFGHVGGTIPSVGAIGSVDVDPDPTNNQQTAVVIVSTTTDVTLEIEGPDRAMARDDITLVLRVDNTGDRVAPGLVLRNPLPPHTAIVPEKSDERWRLQLCGNLRLDAGDIPQDGGHFEFRLTLNILPTHPAGTLFNTASAMFVGTDTNPDDNASAASIRIEPNIPLDSVDELGLAMQYVEGSGQRLASDRVRFQLALTLVNSGTTLIASAQVSLSLRHELAPARVVQAVVMDVLGGLEPNRHFDGGVHDPYLLAPNQMIGPGRHAVAIVAVDLHTAAPWYHPWHFLLAYAGGMALHGHEPGVFVTDVSTEGSDPDPDGDGPGDDREPCVIRPNTFPGVAEVEGVVKIKPERVQTEGGP